MNRIGSAVTELCSKRISHPVVDTRSRQRAVHLELPARVRVKLNSSESKQVTTGRLQVKEMEN